MTRPDDSQEPGRATVNAAGGLLIGVIEVIYLPVTLTVLLVETLVAAEMFGYTEWQRCFGIAVAVAVLNAIANAVKNFVVFPRGRPTRHSLFRRSSEYFVQLLIVNAIVQGFYLRPHLAAALLSTVIVALLVGAINAWVTAVPLPSPEQQQVNIELGRERRAAAAAAKAARKTSGPTSQAHERRSLDASQPTN